ncbi:hypothetical protein PG994_013402 [Apiospora phragmitis]|uniref:2EXR domain-containing protein n=1 Tax=Apiospora phragmitis TaxID=2905665 RepID=A0ABR1TAS2_9PEZI
MSALSTFSPFSRLPTELQVKIWERAMANEHNDRVILLTHTSGHVMLTQDLLNTIPKFFTVCKTSRDTAKSVYDVRLPVVKNTYKLGAIPLSTRLDIFIISPWSFRVGIDPVANSAPFQRSDARLDHDVLAKMERAMQHRFALDGPTVHDRPLFRRSVFRSVKVCYLQVDHQSSAPQSIATQPGGRHVTPIDFWIHYMDPAMYRELTVENDE